MADCALHRFDFKNTIVSFQGVELEGYAEESDSITAVRRMGAGELKIAADGSSGIHIVSSDKSGTVTVKLMQSSDSNDFLWQKHLDAKNDTSAGYGTVTIQDLNRNETWRLAPAYVETSATYAYGSQTNIREWKFTGVCLDKIGGGTFEIVPGGTL